MLKEGSKPHLAKAYSVPFAQREQFLTELNRQCDEGMLSKLLSKEADMSLWGFPAFGVPKKDRKSMRTVGDFRVLSSMLLRSPCFIESIEDLLSSLGTWQWASGIDLNMGCCAMKLCENTRKFVRLVTTWGTHECLVSWMGTSPAGDTFQRRAHNRLMRTPPKPPKCCIEDRLAALDYKFEEHVACLDLMFTSLGNAGLQVSIDKSALFQWALEYVGLWVMREGYKPLESRTQGIMDMQPCRNKKDVRIF